MDTTKFGEGQYLNPEMVEQSPTKKMTISDEGHEEINKFGNPSLTMTIEIDGKKKSWSPRIDHVKNLQQSYGKDSKLWIGQTVSLRVIMMNGKKTIVVIPEIVKTEAVV